MAALSPDLTRVLFEVIFLDTCQSPFLCSFLSTRRIIRQRGRGGAGGGFRKDLPDWVKTPKMTFGASEAGAQQRYGFRTRET